MRRVQLDVQGGEVHDIQSSQSCRSVLDQGQTVGECLYGIQFDRQRVGIPPYSHVNLADATPEIGERLLHSRAVLSRVKSQVKSTGL